MMRQLSVVEYGILASMLSLILIAGTPLEALRTAVAHQAALLTRAGESSAIPAFLMQWARRLAVVGVALLLMGYGSAHYLRDLFQLPTSAPVLLAVWIMATGLFMPLFIGALQGVQSFRWFAVHGQVWGVTRLVMAVLFISVMGATAMAGLWAQGMGVLASIGVGIFALSISLKAHREPVIRPFEGGRYFLLSLLVLSGFAVIMNADVALVKRFFPPDEAGVFARAATIARSIVFLPLPVAAAMFPKVVSQGLTSAADRVILFKAIGFTAGLIVSAGIACSLAMRPIWWVFTGEAPDATTLTLARWLIWAMAPLGLTFLLVHFEIAQRRFKAPLLLILLAVAYVTGVYIWHSALQQVLAVLTSVSVLALLLLLGDILRRVMAVKTTI
jgi:O-antigen/teichoic acid export membrane protein